MIPGQDCSKCPSAKGSAFACLKAAQLTRLSKAAVPHAYQRGQGIFYEGNPALAVFCVRSGLVKLTRQFNHGSAAVVGARTNGDLFGYRAVLAELPYGISAETIEPSVVCTIPREAFLAVIEESHELATHLLKRLAREFRFAEEQLVERNGETVTKRTAHFLVRLAEVAATGTRVGGNATIPTRREDLAQLLGTTPETLSRTLHNLARRGLVRVDRKDIRVLDIAALQQLGRTA